MALSPLLNPKSNMKNTIIITFLYIVGTNIQAQIYHPVRWSYASKRNSKEEATVLLKATIAPGWHIYSQTVKDGGPVKTSIKLDNSYDFKKTGPTTEPKPKIGYDKTFAMKIGIFETSVVFRQKIRLHKKGVTVRGALSYMACNESRCLPPEDVLFSININ